MSHDTGYVGLPVDGVGKIVPQSTMMEIEYDTGTVAMALGDVITFASSTWTGTVIEEGVATASGTVKLRIEKPVPEVPVVVATENILANGIQAAKVLTGTTGTPYYFQQATLVGKDMVNQIEVDDRGALITRSIEGSQQFDAFGRLRVSQGTIIGEYINTYELDTKNWWNEEVTGGTIAHIPGNAGTLYSTTTTSGSRAASTTHLYHRYQLGVSQFCEITVAIGDSGASNVRRVWGYGDATDGLFFRQEEDTSLQVLQRSSTIADKVFNQADWNIDRLDGSKGKFNPSKATLDITKDNIYWVDFQWLGAGRVRFGVMLKGVRVTCHEIYNDNAESVPYMRTGSLPVHVGQVNLATAGSTSEMRVWCAVVKTESKFEPQTKHHYHHIRKREKQNGGVYMAAVTNWHPGRMMFAIRPALTYNSIANRTVAIPKRLSVTNTGTDSMFIQARRGASVLGSPTWEAFHSESAMEYTDTDVDIDQDNRGVQVGMWAIPPQSTENIDLSDVFGYRKERIVLGADGIDQTGFQYVFTAWNMSPIAGGSDAGTYTCTVTAAGNTIIDTGADFTVANYDGVAFAIGQMIKLRNSDSDDGYYLLTAVAATTLTVKNLDGSAVSFTGSTTDVVTIQGGTRTLYFGNLNVEEIF